jgi:hypothetical protein
MWPTCLRLNANVEYGGRARRSQRFEKRVATHEGKVAENVRSVLSFHSSFPVPSFRLTPSFVPQFVPDE